MNNIIKTFFRNLLIKLNGKINKWLNAGDASRELNVADDSVVNFFAMIVKKILNHVFVQCEFSVISDSVLCDPLKKLCNDIQNNCYKIGMYMIGGSDTPQHISECWAVPYFETVNGKQELYHSYIGGNRICITGMRGDRITDCYMVLSATTVNTKTYLLCRHHVLDENGNLTITYFVSNELAQRVTADIPEWREMVQTETVYPGAGHIGFGRYKSPVVSLGNDTYGHPINYGCAVIEQEIQRVIKQIQLEFKSKATKLFPDWSIVRQRPDGTPGGLYCIDEYIYPIKHMQGQNSSLIDEFSPEIRESSYYTHLNNLLEQYQALMGVSELITHRLTGNGATATEVYTLNIDNISLEENIRKVIRKGNIDTLQADSIYLGIPFDLWSYDETWENIYEDEQSRLDNLLKMYANSAAEQIDLIKYWFPTLTDEEAQEKLMRINAEKQQGIQANLENLLNI